MANILLDLIHINESINYTSLIGLMVIYLIFFWAAISVWVIIDGRKRIKNRFLPFILGILNFIFLPPFLILYILLRPEEKDSYDDAVDGGVNIPIVNFTGKEGQVALSFELRINPKHFVSEKESEMKIDINFDSSDPDKKLLSVPQEELVTVSSKGTVTAKTGFKSKMSNKLSGWKKKFFKSTDEKPEPKEETREITQQESGETEHQQSQDQQEEENAEKKQDGGIFSFNKHKKHKKRRR